MASMAANATNIAEYEPDYSSIKLNKELAGTTTVIQSGESHIINQESTVSVIGMSNYASRDENSIAGFMRVYKNNVNIDTQSQSGYTQAGTQGQHFTFMSSFDALAGDKITVSFYRRPGGPLSSQRATIIETPK